MERLVGQITIIDTLGILMPGAILTLAINHYQLWDLTIPWREFFGQGELSLLIYFAGLSYLLGSIIHQIGEMLEKRLSSGLLKEYNMHESYWKDAAVQNAYKKIFLKEPPVGAPGKSKEKIRDEQITASQQVFHAVQQKKRPSRIVLFSAFFAMSRAMVLTLLCLLLMAIFTGNFKLLTSVVYLVGILVFGWRWMQYEQRCIAEAYHYLVQNSKEFIENMKEDSEQ